MFELELIGLLNDYKKASEYDKKKIKESISKLIAQNEDKLSDFIEKNEVDTWAKTLIEECAKEKQEKEEEKVEKQEQESEYKVIRKAYEKWLGFYEKNNREADENCEKVILEIINFYAGNRFEVIEQILSIDDTEDYESFKNMLMNYLRKYFVTKVKAYRESEKYKSLGFFAKSREKRKILDLYKEIGAYKFNKSHIEEVLNGS